MKAMLFSAGLGTRLYPLTKDKPKALVEVCGKTLLEHNIIKLKNAGIDCIVVNIHHFADSIIDFLKTNNNFNMNIIISDERNELLETGGGLLKAKKYFHDNENILLYNVDILSDINIKEIERYHIESDALATLAIRNRKSSRNLLFDEKLKLCGWKNNTTNEVINSRQCKSPIKFAFSGIHIIKTKLLDLMQYSGKFSITPLYLELSKTESIKGYIHDSDYWFDVGSIEKLNVAEKKLCP